MTIQASKFLLGALFDEQDVIGDIRSGYMKGTTQEEIIATIVAYNLFLIHSKALSDDQSLNNLFCQVTVALANEVEKNTGERSFSVQLAGKNNRIFTMVINGHLSKDGKTEEAPDLMELLQSGMEKPFIIPYRQIFTACRYVNRTIKEKKLFVDVDITSKSIKDALMRYGTLESSVFSALFLVCGLLSLVDFSEKSRRVIYFIDESSGNTYRGVFFDQGNDIHRFPPVTLMKLLETPETQEKIDEAKIYGQIVSIDNSPEGDVFTIFS